MLAGQREDRAVVTGVARPIQQVHTVDRVEGGRQPVHDLKPAALTDIRDGLDEHLSMLASVGARLCLIRQLVPDRTNAVRLLVPSVVERELERPAGRPHPFSVFQS